MPSLLSKRSLSWWIRTLFIIGSSLFAIGSLQLIAGDPATAHVDTVYFVGSIFFTLAAYGQLNQVINARGDSDPFEELGQRRYVGWDPSNLDYWSVLPQFLGTLAFNLSTFAAYLDVGWLGYDMTNWAPDYVGSALFLLSGGAAILAAWGQTTSGRDRQIASVNFVGCAAFIFSATVAFVRPDQHFVNLATWATLFTLIGAVCFLAGAYLMDD